MKTTLLIAAAAFTLIAVPASGQSVTTCTIVQNIAHCDIAPGSRLAPGEAAKLLAVNGKNSLPAPMGRDYRMSSWDYRQAALQATPTRELPPTYPLQPPFSMSTYIGPTIGVVSLGPDGFTPR